NQTTTVFGEADIAEADHLVLTANNISGSQGTPFNNVQVATFTDTYTGHPDGSDFFATIDWGDGTVTQGTVVGSGASFTVDGTHTYATPGTDTTTVTVQDDDIGAATRSGSRTSPTS